MVLPRSALVAGITQTAHGKGNSRLDELDELLTRTALLLVPTPLAFAFPPGETWQSGVYDGDDDHGKLHLASASTSAVVETHRLDDYRPTTVAKDSVDIDGNLAKSLFRPMSVERRVALLLLAVLALIAPLGYASLPDQTWLGGLWDGADDDDAIISVQSTIGTVEPFLVLSTDSLLVPVGFVVPPAKIAVVRQSVSADPSRAPPAL